MRPMEQQMHLSGKAFHNFYLSLIFFLARTSVLERRMGSQIELLKEETQVDLFMFKNMEGNGNGDYSWQIFANCIC